MKVQPGPSSTSTDLRRAVAAAYDETGGSWERGAGRVYNHLSDVIVDLSPVPLTGRTVVDLGAGTGAASHAIERRGGRPIAIDAALGVLTGTPSAAEGRRPPAAVADVLALPMPDDCVDGAVAAFSFNHVAAPDRALAEARRVCRPGSPIVAANYAADDDHPAKAAVEAVLRRHGWRRPTWHAMLGRDAMPMLATIEGAERAAGDAGLSATVQHVRVPMPWLNAADIVSWRFGMAQHAPYVDRLPRDERAALRDAAIAELGADPPPLTRSIIVISAIV